MDINNESCYWCGAPSVSREHVPPKCLFPEQKDTKKIYTQSFRSHLITVPSCEKHNLSKSNDDEYLMMCLASKVGNNDVAYIHTVTKLHRAILRHPDILNIEEESIIDAGEAKFPIAFVKVDNYRLAYSFEAIARGLYYHEHGRQYLGDCIILSNIFLNYSEDDDDFNAIKQIRMISLIEKEQIHWGTCVKGENPKVFTYQFSPIDGFDAQTVALTFYEKTRVYVCMANKSKLEKYKSELELVRQMLLGF